jgi:glycosyltransferase involved in cell wall biosynthesis
MADPSVTVLIPTYKRAHLLDHVLEGLTNQTTGGFEVLVVAKPSGDATEKVVEKYRGKLEVRLLLQRWGYMVEALNLGLRHAKGDIIVFLDDDAIPFPDLIRRHIESYRLSNVGGVSGDVLKASLGDPDLAFFKDKPSDLLPNRNKLTGIAKIAFKLWNKPLAGEEVFLFYISRSGVASINYYAAAAAKCDVVKSLLARGANMSVLYKAVNGFQFPSSWIQGFTFEQYLSWHIAKQGYCQIFNPKIKVYHLEHGASLSRNDLRRQVLLYTEQKLLYYRLKKSEPSLSLMHRMTWLLFELVLDVKHICLDRDINRLAGLKSTWNSLLIGIKVQVGAQSKALGDLEKLQVAS